MVFGSLGVVEDVVCIFDVVGFCFGQCDDVCCLVKEFCIEVVFEFGQDVCYCWWVY